MSLKESILKRESQVAIIGLGYVGLPLSVALAKAQYKVIGIDYNASWVDEINQGRSNIIDVPSQVLKEVVDAGYIKASTDYSKIIKADAIIICVPTPLNNFKEPDLSYIKKAVDGILPYIKHGVLISLESTTYPGTTEELIVERIQNEKNWEVGVDFYVCYSPERVDPGNPVYSVENTAKVIGGSTRMCLELGETLYKAFLPDVVGVKSTQVAEMSKVLENTFRCVNIALVNEMTMMCERMGIDIWEAIKGASSKPFGFMPFYPGPGVGGHCIPLDPLYLAWKAKEYNYFSRFIEAAVDINNNMPYYVLHQISDILGHMGKGIKGSRILLMGMSYKKDIGDMRESPSLEVYEVLKKQNPEISFYDPYVQSFRSKQGELERIELTESEIKSYDLVVILVGHSQIDYEWILQNAKMIYDTKNVYADIESDKIVKLGENLECFKC
ncbi:MAG: nucleotide sugar dehydrogenase [Cellulosilyticum sp.]|nr:nucleotide sugar dehydrogenase [Cellulosilyticum sp.]